MSEPRYYYGCDSHGLIRQCLFGELIPDDGYTYVEVVGEVNETAAVSHYLYRCVDGVAVETDIPMTPEDHYVWDDENGAWADSRDLQGHKDAKWGEIKEARSAEEFGTFLWNDHAFDCDEVSQRRIQGAVQLAALDTNTVMDWTLADNTVQAFNATELQQIGQALGAHVNACHVKARGLRDQINAAESEAELSVISW